MNIQNKIEQLLTDGYEFNFSQYISDAFTVVGKYAGGFIGYTLIYFIISSSLSNVPYVGSIISTLIAYCLVVGFHIIAHRIRRNETFEFGNFFDGFQRFKDLAILSIFITIITIIAAIPMIAVIGFEAVQVFLSQEPDAIVQVVENMNWGLFALTFIPLIYISVSYAWSIFFVYFHHMQPWEGMEASRKLITKKWFTFFGFNIVLGLIAIAGLLVLIVGIIYAVPVVTIASYLAFEDIVGFGEAEESDDLFDHFIQED